MGFTVQQAQSELASRPQKTSDNDTSVEEAQAELNRRAQQPTTGQGIKNLLSLPGQTLVEAGQTLSNIVQGLPGAQPLARKIISLLPESVKRGTGLPPDVRQRLSESLQNIGGILPQAPTAARVGGGLLGGGTALALGGEVGGAALRGIPALSKVAQLAERFPKIAGTAGMSALVSLGSPDHRGRGALIGAGLGGAGEVLGALLKGAGKIIKPNLAAKGIVENLPKAKSAENVLTELGDGKSLNENTQNIAAKIKKAGDVKLKESGERFEDINKRAGVNSIYPEGKPVSKDSYKALEKWKRPPMMSYTDTLKDAHEDFMNIPTFDKAHKLQSTLGSVANRTLKNPASNMQQIDVANRFLMAQDRLLNDMRSHLNNIDPTKQLSTEYDGARNLHVLEAVPYKDSKQIREIVKGKVQNPGNLTTIFKNPESNVLKIVKDLGPKASDQIVYNELRATVGENPTAEKLIKAYSGLEKKGLSSYTSPKLDQKIGNLKQTEAQEEFLKRIGSKPTSEKLLKSADKLEDKDMLRNLSPSVQDKINNLRTNAARAKWIKRGAGIAGLGLLAKELLPSHIRREIF
jgi:hypothetical protein